VKRALYRSPNSYAIVDWALVKEMGGNITLAAVFYWVAWKSEQAHSAHKADDATTWYSASLREMAEEMSVTERVLQRALDRLESEGHIESRQFRLHGSYDRTKAYRPLWNEAEKPLTKRLDGLHQKVESSSNRTVESSSSINTYSSNSSLEEAKASPEVVIRGDVEFLCTLLADSVESNGARRPNVTKKWRDEARKLLDRDKVTLADAERVLRWSQADSFWRSNILSMPKFREKFDQLVLKSGNGSAQASKAAQSIDAGLALAAMYAEQEGSSLAQIGSN
jgi:hypothetical protein